MSELLKIWVLHNVISYYYEFSSCLLRHLKALAWPVRPAQILSRSRLQAEKYYGLAVNLQILTRLL